MYERYIKRLLDILFSAICIIVFAVPMLIVAVVIKIDSPGPVLFKQIRLGRNKRVFTIYKFRSMPVTAPSDVATRYLDSTQIHMTEFQKFIRKYSIDELPQLFNILAGSCSVVGPRPVLCNEEDLIRERDKYGVYDAKPGVTGWAQVNGRDKLNFEDKARLDGDYVKQVGFLFDLKCFLLTIKCVLTADDVVEGNTQTTDEKNLEQRETIALGK